MLHLTVRDFLWSILVGWLALAWQLDAQVQELESADHRDNAALFRADNAILERENAKHRTRIRQLERHVSSASQI
jgi:hypothetical protein